MKRTIQHTPARDPEAIQFARDQRATTNEFARVRLAMGPEPESLRDEALAREGYLAVRISGFDVLSEPERVCQGIEERLRERMRERELTSGAPSPPAPLPAAGRGETR